MFSTIKMYALVALVTAAGAAYLYVQHLESSLEVERQNSLALKNAVEEQSRVLEQRTRDIEQIQDINGNLYNQVVEQGKVIRELEEKFEIRANGTSRDLGKITRDKPGLVNKIINNATNDVNRCLEIVTGAPLTEGESNNECQDYINTLN